jgi:hypothetical protein
MGTRTSFQGCIIGGARRRAIGRVGIRNRSGKDGFWDTTLRHGDSYEGTWRYVRDNPVRDGLVTRAEEWPYHGELTPLSWE